MTEPVFGEDSLATGIYIGNTHMYNLPFFLDSAKLVNPHISILGMTGSGKTYLIKSIITRSGFLKERAILILDWNAEYNDVVQFLYGKVNKISSLEDLPDVECLLSGVNSIDLSSIQIDSERISIAQELLNRIHSFVLSLQPSNMVSKVVVVDEAWKLQNLEQNLGRLFREGRKFGVMVIAATQLVNDVNNEVLANAACSFVFRMKGSENLDSLVTSGLVAYEDLDRIQSLGRGSCMVSLVYRNINSPKRFPIKLVSGVSFSIYAIRCGSMVVSLTLRKMSSMMEKLHLDNEKRMQIIKALESNRRGFDLAYLVDLLFKIGLGRADTITLLRSFGIKDSSVALAIESLKGVELVK